MLKWNRQLDDVKEWGNEHFDLTVWQNKWRHPNIWLDVDKKSFLYANLDEFRISMNNDFQRNQSEFFADLNKWV